MARRKTKHRTGLPRIGGIGKKVHDAWIGYVCINCDTLNCFSIGNTLLDPKNAYLEQKWVCGKCKYIHSKDSPLPFREWPSEYTDPDSLKCQRFWQAAAPIPQETPFQFCFPGWKYAEKYRRHLSKS